jgi:hypothetical protein
MVHLLTSLAFGFTFAFSVAEVGVTDDATPVSTVGLASQAVQISRRLLPESAK